MRTREQLQVRKWQLEHMASDLLARMESVGNDYWCGDESEYMLDGMNCRLIDVENELAEIKELLT